MTRPETKTCEGCGATIAPTRRFNLATSVANHLKTCPSRHASVKQEDQQKDKT